MARTLALALVLGLALPQCRHRASVAEESAAVSSRSYPILAHYYHTVLTVRATPHELMGYLFRDLSWTQEMSGALQVRIPGDVSGLDMTRPGQSLDFKIRLMGVNFPCRIVTLKYLPDREFWLMIITRGAWILWRLNTEPAPEGTQLTAEMMGQTTAGLDSFLDAFQLVKAGSLRFDRMLAMVQAHFDPGLDPEVATAHGLRGNLYDSYVKGYEASIFVAAAPKDLAARVFSGERLMGLLPLMSVGPDCAAAVDRLTAGPRDVVYCHGSWGPAGPEFPAAALCGTGLDRREGRSRNVWIVVSDILMRVQVEITPEGGGSRLKLIVSTELPGQDNPSVMDLMSGIAALPTIMEQALLEARREAEGAGAGSKGAGAAD